MKDDINTLLCEAFSEPVTVTSTQSSSGGSINQTQVLILSNGEKVFLKSNSRPPQNFFRCEAKGLEILAGVEKGPRIPKVLGMDPSPLPKFLLLEYIEEISPNGAYYNNFGHTLAELHQNTQERFGLDHDNFIGRTEQKNSAEKDGLVFFRDNRIRFQQELARKSGKLPVKTDQRLDKLCDKLGNILNLDSEKPALLHGDLWSGNYFSASGQTPCMVDPAVYYGPREADLAMTELFGKAPQSFYDAYMDAFPLEPGYQERKKIYNLYHLLNHLNLFGGSYLSSVEGTVNEFVV